MIYTLIFLSALTIFFSMRYFMGKHSVMLSSMIISTMGMIFFLLMYISKFNKYIIKNPLFKYDYLLFIKISKLQIDYYSIIFWFNIFFSLYIAIMLLFSFTYFKTDEKWSKSKKALVYISYISLAEFTIFYNPNTSLMMYTAMYSYANAHIHNLIKNSVYAIDFTNYIFLAAYCIIPIYCAVHQYKKTYYVYKKHQIMFACICLTLLNVLCIFTMVFATFKRPYIFSTPEVMLFTSYTQKIPSSMFLSFSLLFPVVMLFFVFVIIRYKIIHNADILYHKNLKKKMFYLNKNMISIFHAFKNIVFTYKIGINKALNSTPEQAKDILRELDIQMTSFIDMLTRTTTINNSIDLQPDEFDILELLDDTLKNIRSTKKILFKRDYCSDKLTINADSFYIADVFKNIIQNAADAIDRSENEEGLITVTVIVEYDWIIIQIGDNGTGINPKDLKRIFKPLFSTKSSITNWGMGLSFADKIIKMHKGNIHVKSRVGKGTEFTVSLPKRLQKI